MKSNPDYDDYDAEIQSWPEVVAARKLGDVPDVLMTSFMEKASGILARRDRATQDYHHIKDMKQDLINKYYSYTICGLVCLSLLITVTFANLFGVYKWPVFAVFSVPFISAVLHGLRKLVTAQSKPDLLEDSYREAYACQQSVLAVLRASLEDWVQSSHEPPETGQATLH